MKGINEKAIKMLKEADELYLAKQQIGGDKQPWYAIFSDCPGIGNHHDDYHYFQGGGSEGVMIVFGGEECDKLLCGLELGVLYKIAPVLKMPEETIATIENEEIDEILYKDGVMLYDR